jgi:phosphoglycolate phosphatase
MSARALLFDLDGTLTDPRSGIVSSLRHALERLERTSPSDDVLATFIGPPLRATFAGLLETSSPELIERAVALYRERFGTIGLFENEVYPGVREMLDATRRLAPAAFVATSKAAVYAERIVKHFGLDHHFARVYGSELAGRFDDKAELLPHLLAAEGIAPGAAVMIGDRSVDVLAARAAGIPSVGVLWGYGPAAELTEAGADVLCASPAELPACLERLAG